MAVYRIIHISFWQDTFVLNLTPEEKFFYIYLMTNSKTNQLGCYELPKKIIEMETGYNRETVDKLLQRFNDYNKIFYSEDTNEILLLNWHKYSWNKSPKIKACIEKEIENVKTPDFIRFLEPLFIEYGYSMDRVSIPLWEKEKENKNKKKNKNKKEKENKDTVFFPNDEKLNQTFLDFMDMRKKIKAPMTDRAITMMVNKISKYDNETAIKMLEQSILNNWKDIYPLKNEVRNKAQQKQDDFINNAKEWLNEQRGIFGNSSNT